MLPGSALISGFVEQKSPEWRYHQIVLIVAAHALERLNIGDPLLAAREHFKSPFERECERLQCQHQSGLH